MQCFLHYTWCFCRYVVLLSLYVVLLSLCGAFVIICGAFVIMWCFCHYMQCFLHYMWCVSKVCGFVIMPLQRWSVACQMEAWKQFIQPNMTYTHYQFKMASGSFNGSLMSNILKDLNIGSPNILENFQREKITLDIIGKFKVSELECLGITCKSQMMRLRTECVKYGEKPPQKIYHKAGAPSTTCQRT